AAGDPVSDRPPIPVGERELAALLERPVAHASRGLERAFAVERLRRAGAQAARAISAERRHGHRPLADLPVDQDFREEEIAAELRMDQKRVLADPAQARERGPAPLENGARVDAGFPAQVL